MRKVRDIKRIQMQAVIFGNVSNEVLWKTSFGEIAFNERGNMYLRKNNGANAGWLATDANGKPYTFVKDQMMAVTEILLPFPTDIKGEVSESVTAGKIVYLSN